jgi:hypothetical protein
MSEHGKTPVRGRGSAAIVRAFDHHQSTPGNRDNHRAATTTRRPNATQAALIDAVRLRLVGTGRACLDDGLTRIFRPRRDVLRAVDAMARAGEVRVECDRYGARWVLLPWAQVPR